MTGQAPEEKESPIGERRGRNPSNKKARRVGGEDGHIDGINAIAIDDILGIEPTSSKEESLTLVLRKNEEPRLRRGSSTSQVNGVHVEAAGEQSCLLRIEARHRLLAHGHSRGNRGRERNRVHFTLNFILN
jgi:hypothetical protein